MRSYWTAAREVRVIYVRGSGCYGLNGADAVSFDAAILSQAVGRPVRLQFSRQDEMMWENFGAACVVEHRAGLGRWTHRGLGSRGLGGFAGQPPRLRPARKRDHRHARWVRARPLKPGLESPTGKFRNQSNTVPPYFAGCVAGNCGGDGTIRSERALTHTVRSPFFTGPLRSPLRIQNTFANECFMDELCAHAKADPVAFRLQHLQDPRVIGVLKAAAKAANWEARPSPQTSWPRAGSCSGRGIACVAYEGDNGYAALVAEVDVNLETGTVRPTRFVVAVDCGPISNPDGLRNQIEGGILQGMSRALVEEVTWDNRRITSVDWETYNSLHLDYEMPDDREVFVTPPDVSATGAGETAITVTPPRSETRSSMQRAPAYGIFPSLLSVSKLRCSRVAEKARAGNDEAWIANLVHSQSLQCGFLLAVFVGIRPQERTMPGHLVRAGISPASSAAAFEESFPCFAILAV